ncbi:MFS general substrate transporter, partial [Martensiomyces pterosporus]
VTPETHRRMVSKKHRIQQINIPPPLSLKDNNPLVDLADIRYPVVALTLFYFAMIIGAYLTNATGNPLTFENIYGLSQGTSGLCFLPVGVGNIVGSVCGGRLIDLILRRRRRATEAALEAAGSGVRAKPPPEVRLKAVWFGSTVALCALITTGWLIDKHVSLAAVLVAQFFLGVGVAFTFQCLSGYLIDMFPKKPARITGLQNFWRSIWAAVIVQIFPSMIENVGWGWSYTIMFFLTLAGALAVQVAVFKGEQLRKRFGPMPSG